MTSHRARIIDQFTHQAVPFSNSPAIKNDEALALLVQASRATPADTVLDVACGPGLVVAAFARVARRVTGIDVTPAMIARAGELNAGHANVELALGDVLSLPYPDASFSIVVSRLAFHHFQEPSAVLAEMRRVCLGDGRVVVCDLLASDDPERAAAFHAMEMLRDPSHARALRLAELLDLFREQGLTPEQPVFYRLPFELEDLLARSFPKPEHLASIRAAFTASLADDGLGLDTRRVGGEIHGSHRVAIVSARADGA